MIDLALTVVIGCAFLAGVVVGGLVAFWVATRSFNISLEEIDLEHHEQNLERNYNFLKLGRRSDRWKDRHWDN